MQIIKIKSYQAIHYRLIKSKCLNEKVHLKKKKHKNCKPVEKRMTVLIFNGQHKVLRFYDHKIKI